MSLKFRLPTWRFTLQNTATRKNTKLQLTWSGYCNFKRFSQRPLLSEKQRGTKKSAPTVAAMFRSRCCWCDDVGDAVLRLMELQVVVEVSVETMLMQLSLLFLFRSLVDGGVNGVGFTFCVYTISTNHDKLFKKNYTGHSKSNFISAHIFQTLHWINTQRDTSTASTFCTWSR